MKNNLSTKEMNKIKHKKKEIANKREKSFLSKQELAQHLGLSIYTIDMWVYERKEIPFVRMGRRIMFDINDVSDWINKNKISPKI